MRRRYIKKPPKEALGILEEAQERFGKEMDRLKRAGKSIPSGPTIYLGGKSKGKNPNDKFASYKDWGDQSRKMFAEQKETSFVEYLDRPQKQNLWQKIIGSSKGSAKNAIESAKSKAIPVTVVDSLETLRSVKVYAQRLEAQKRKSGKDPHKLRLTSKDLDKLIELKKQENMIKQIERQISAMESDLRNERFQKPFYKQIRANRKRITLNERLEKLLGGKPITSGTYRPLRLMSEGDIETFGEELNTRIGKRNMEVRRLQIAFKETGRILDTYKQMRYEGEMQAMEKASLEEFRADLIKVSGKVRKAKVREQIEKLQTRKQKTRKPKTKPKLTPRETANRIRSIRVKGLTNILKISLKNLKKFEKQPAQMNIFAKTVLDGMSESFERLGKSELSKEEVQEIIKLGTQIFSSKQLQGTIIGNAKFTKQYGQIRDNIAELTPKRKAA